MHCSLCSLHYFLSLMSRKAYFLWLLFLGICVEIFVIWGTRIFSNNIFNLFSVNMSSCTMLNSISVFTAIFGIYIAHMWAIYIMTLKQLIFVIQWHEFCVLCVCATMCASVYVGKHTKSEVNIRCLPILLSTFPFVLRYRLSLQPEFLSARLVEQ